MKKRGLSPVMATVLLIALVVILAAIIFIWARGFLSEQVSKFDGPVENACGRVDFEASIVDLPEEGLALDVNNRGNVPIYGFVIKSYGTGTVLANEVFDQTITVGSSESINLNEISNDISGANDFLVVPIILGETDDGKVAHTCGDETGIGVGAI